MTRRGSRPGLLLQGYQVRLMATHQPGSCRFLGRYGLLGSLWSQRRPDLHGRLSGELDHSTRQRRSEITLRDSRAGLIRIGGWG